MQQVQCQGAAADGPTADTARQVTGPHWSDTWQGCPVCYSLKKDCSMQLVHTDTRVTSQGRLMYSVNTNYERSAYKLRALSL